MKEELRKTRAEVREFLERFPDARNNDFYVQWLWLKYYGGMSDLPYLEWGRIKQVSGKLETVRRARQKIQNDDHEFPPTDPEVLARRMAKMKKYREDINEV